MPRTTIVERGLPSLPRQRQQDYFADPAEAAYPTYLKDAMADQSWQWRQQALEEEAERQALEEQFAAMQARLDAAMEPVAAEKPPPPSTELSFGGPDWYIPTGEPLQDAGRYVGNLGKLAMWGLNKWSEPVRGAVGAFRGWADPDIGAGEGYMRGVADPEGYGKVSGLVGFEEDPEGSWLGNLMRKVANFGIDATVDTPLPVPGGGSIDDVVQGAVGVAPAVGLAVKKYGDDALSALYRAIDDLTASQGRRMAHDATDATGFPPTPGQIHTRELRETRRADRRAALQQAIETGSPVPEPVVKGAGKPRPKRGAEPTSNQIVPGEEFAGVRPDRVEHVKNEVYRLALMDDDDFKIAYEAAPQDVRFEAFRFMNKNPNRASAMEEIDLASPAKPPPMPKGTTSAQPRAPKRKIPEGPTARVRPERKPVTWEEYAPNTKRGQTPARVSKEVESVAVDVMGPEQASRRYQVEPEQVTTEMEAIQDTVQELQKKILAVQPDLSREEAAKLAAIAGIHRSKDIKTSTSLPLVGKGATQRPVQFPKKSAKTLGGYTNRLADADVPWGKERFYPGSAEARATQKYLADPPDLPILRNIDTAAMNDYVNYAMAKAARGGQRIYDAVEDLLPQDSAARGVLLGTLASGGAGLYGIGKAISEFTQEEPPPPPPPGEGFDTAGQYLDVEDRTIGKWYRANREAAARQRKQKRAELAAKALKRKQEWDKKMAVAAGAAGNPKAIKPRKRKR